MDEKLIIVGTGETALLAYEYFTKDSAYDVVAFAVNKEFIKEAHCMGLPVFALEELLNTHSVLEYKLFVAMGSGELNHARTKVYLACKKMGYTMASYISSRSFVWDNVSIGENCFILEDNTLQPFTSIGNNVVLWSGNHIGHRSVIKDNCFITSHVIISGFCEIGENTFIGVNASIADNVCVGKNNFIGMASRIHKHTEDDAVFIDKATEKAKLTAKIFCGVKS